MSRRRWIVGALLLVTVVATLAGLRPGAAAQLEVRSAPLQTWRLDVEPPLPPLVEDESAEDELPQPTTPDSLTPAVPAPETTPGSPADPPGSATPGAPASPGTPASPGSDGDQPTPPAPDSPTDPVSELTDTIGNGLAGSGDSLDISPTPTELG